MTFARSCSLFLCAFLIGLNSCGPQKPGNTDVGKLGVNEEVSEHLRRFEGRGALTDESQPLKPEEALQKFKVTPELKIDLVLAEPRIFQPVEMKFDHKGRLWVVQYNQYPYPKGLKIVGVDNHLRLQFDKVPAPPPTDQKGADRITFFEDKDGDGHYEKSTDAITGLNITTSVLPGKGKIWVLSPPYLLAYHDRDDNGIPEGDPEVHLSGFGLEDTHAVANSLRWGPDGWIYGAQGSTTTANISSKVSKNVKFSGQAIWRYHPVSQVFEIYGEGGGNTFNVEIDAKGRVFSGTNGYGRGPYFKQGSYFKKSWGKHGPLTNPYAFGYLEDMPLEGENTRFTHALIRYEGGNFPARYNDQFIALNPLQGNLMLTGVAPNGSSLKNKDIEKIVDTPDRWFRPIDIKTGPDGNVYFTDWYDSRLSHVDARDTWHKTSGRIYRLSPAGKTAGKQKPVDYSRMTSKSLADQFYSANRWIRFTAVEELGQRNDRSIAPVLQALLKSDTTTIGLECLWTLNWMGLFDEKTALTALNHADPFVREWGVRLIGDRRNASLREKEALLQLAQKENNLSVRSQLAASARRLPADLCLGLVKNLAIYHDDAADPDIPLMLWWALESKAESARGPMAALFQTSAFLERPVTANVLLERIIQRYAMPGDAENYATCEKIINQKLTDAQKLQMLVGLEEGLRGVPFENLPEGIKKSLALLRAAKGEPPLAAGLRQKSPEAVKKALEVIADPKSPVIDRLTYVRMMGESDFPESIQPLLRVVSASSSSEALKQAALSTLTRYDKQEIGDRVVRLYPDFLRGDPDVKLASLSLLTSRPGWAKALLAATQGIKSIKPDDLPMEMVNRMKLLKDPQIESELYTIWPQARESSSSERGTRIAAVQKILKDGQGNGVKGKEVFTVLCGSCHKMDGEGADIGPELTGYDRRDVNYFIMNTVDPNADIREGYATYTLKAKTGQTVVGRLLERTAQSVKIKPMAGEEQTFSMQEVEELEPLPVSLMPERLLDALSDQEVRDLFRFIQEGAR
ncbi:HEAT repeat domain-containing protein [Ravibacter arvi]|uniref:HEAT repeat domain-containing protein n=1 Tax=Ravibacter arvi TaxID=2051041 RepID=A0ABP8M7M8_9BACT